MKPALKAEGYNSQHCKLLMCSKRQFRDKKWCLCRSIIDTHFLFSCKYFKIYFLIDHHYGTQSESSESVTFVRFLWCSGRVFMICDTFIRIYHRNELKYHFMVEINTFFINYNYYGHATMHLDATDTPFLGHQMTSEIKDGWSTDTAGYLVARELTYFHRTHTLLFVI